MRHPSTRPGTVIGPYTAVAPTDKLWYKAIVWQWRCECGETEYDVPGRMAAKNRQHPLACTHQKPLTGRPASQLAGDRSGSLVVLDVARQDRNGEFVWRCQCDCGATTTVRGSRLKSRETTMCPECAAERRKTPDGYRIRDARLQAGMTQRQVAALIGVSFQRAQQLENLIRVRDCEIVLKKIAESWTSPGAAN